EKLLKLGFRTVRHVIGLPDQVLKRRFGNELVQRLAQMMGKEEEFIIDPLKPVLPYTERLSCLEPIKTAKGIEIAIEKLLDKFCLRPNGEGLGVCKVNLSCYHIDG